MKRNIDEREQIGEGAKGRKVDDDSCKEIKQCSLFDAFHFQLDLDYTLLTVEQIEEETKRRKAEDDNSKENYMKAYMPTYHMTADMDESEQLKQCSLFDVVHCQEKLFLVLDLDHTLLNSTPFEDMDHDEALRISSLCGNAAAHDIHALPDLSFVTKLRPFVHDFLHQVSTMFEMYVYTMGTRRYAEAMVRLLDPSRRFFGNRVISRDDNNCSKFKSLDFILAPTSATIILDDSNHVWPNSLENLIQIERYHFFNSSTREFGIKAPSLLGALKDESNKSGTLAHTLDILRAVHHVFFDELDSQKSSAEEHDVRDILRGLRSSLLTGCKIVFSKVFPMDAASSNPNVHLLWRLAEQLGAICSTTLDASVTHVVAYHAGSEGARWARHHHRQLVHPRWIKATFFTWKRPAESDFAVDATPMLSTFSETASLLKDDACDMGLNVTSEPQSSIVSPIVQCCG